MIIISDTSSISNLIQIDLIYILQELFEDIYITSSVREELYVLPKQKKIIESLDWIKTQNPQNQTLVEELLEELDIGEAHSIILALETNAKFLIIDEYKGRVIAEQRGVKIIGVLGILIKAKQNNIIPLVKPHIDKLVTIGFRIKPSLIRIVLQKVNEL
ncbi:DUF3368 domain-containing protein [Bernardetia sp. ABR2-2B]|uniref:DUF3368 domain-containing protein n=1 Tax=Bernardetia sp. ABR2-2B TaxID=3127472 RepID=UPI0030D451BC